MVSPKSAAMLGAIALTAAAISPAVAQPTIETVAEGLEAPRGVFVASDGSVYVAEAGTAGDSCVESGEFGTLCMGPSGSIARIVDGTVERVVEGLMSGGPEGEIGGVSDAAIADDGTFYYIINGGGPPDTRPSTEMGTLFRLADDGTSEAIADVSAFEASDDPDGAAVPDSNPHAIALVDGGVIVADAGGNDLLFVDDAGTVSLLAVFPPREQMIPAEVAAMLGALPEGEGGESTEAAASEAAEGEAPAAGEMIPFPVESVPTAVEVGPDGAYYVGELTGAPFLPGAAMVWRVVPGEEPTAYATGLTNVMGLAFGPDGTLYVAEIVHDGLMSVFMDPTGSTPPIGAVMSVAPGGGEAELLASGEQLMALGGLDVADDGSIYVTANTLMPGAGTLVKITP